MPKIFGPKVEGAPAGRIIALGGGGFSDEPDNLLLDMYILEQSGKPEPKVLFLPTAGGDNDEYIEKFYRSYRKLKCRPSHLSLTKKNITRTQLEEIVFDNDVIFVGGGSAGFLMQAWKKHGLDSILKKAWEQGIMLSGMSAGAMCWFGDGFKNTQGDSFKRVKCLGLLKGSFCPHYEKRSWLQRSYRKMISQRKIGSGYGVPDGVALHFIGTELMKVISSRQNVSAYFVKRSGFRISEKELMPVYLGIRSPEETSLRDEIIETAKRFVECINKKDVQGMKELMSGSHVFIDSMGTEFKGKELMEKAWESYFSMVPDYRITVDESFAKGDSVALFGRACGTITKSGITESDNKFDIPASWKAIVRDGMIMQWRVYADNTIVHKLMEKVFNT